VYPCFVRSACCSVYCIAARPELAVAVCGRARHVIALGFFPVLPGCSRAARRVSSCPLIMPDAISFSVEAWPSCHGVC
jgi:hypothetical protein